MKKIYIIAGILLLAAACQKQASVQQPTIQAPNYASSTSPDNPAASGNNTYKSDKYGFSIEYNPNLGFSTDVNQIRSLSYIPACDETTVACVYITQKNSPINYKGTNLDAAGVSVNIDRTLNTEPKCYNFKVATNVAQTQLADVAINGVTFKSATGNGAAAGHFETTQVYRNFHIGMCYELALRVAELNLAMLDTTGPDAIKEFNSREVRDLMERVVNTFKFTK